MKGILFMKQPMIFFLLTVIFATHSFSAETSSFQPANPKIGEKVTLTYDPAAVGAVHSNANELYAVILFLHANGDMPSMLEKKMERTGNRWETSFTVDNVNAVSFSVRYDSDDKIDDNGSKAWNILLTGKNGKPLMGAQFMQALLHLQKNYFGFKHLQDSAKAMEALRRELKLYPNNWRANLLVWGIDNKKTGDEKTKQRIAKELAAVYGREKNNELAVRDLLQWFTLTNQSKKSDEIESIWLKKSPDGAIAEWKAQQEFMKEKEQGKRAALAAQYVERFTVKRGMEPMFISAFLRAKDYAKAVSFIEKYPTVSSNYYNSIGNSLISKGEQIDKGVEIVKRGLDRTIAGDVRTNLDFIMLTRKEWKQNITYLRGMIADTYGEGLMKTGKYTEAETILEESNLLMESDDTDNNARLVECYVKNGKNDKAISVSYSSLVKGKGNPLLISLYKTAYTAVKGTEAGFDSMLTIAKTEMGKELRIKLKKEIVDNPSIDFELKSLNGAMVKLSDLKGKVVVLDFWATWCGPCLSSFPTLQKMYDRFKNNPNIVILAINTWERVKPEEREQHVRDFIAKSKYTFPVLFDKEAVNEYGVEGIPTKFIIDKNGRIRFKDVGFGGAQEMEDKMELQFEMLLGDEVSTVK